MALALLGLLSTSRGHDHEIAPGGHPCTCHPAYHEVGALDPGCKGRSHDGPGPGASVASMTLQCGNY